jgi:hypothetical protein
MKEIDDDPEYIDDKDDRKMQIKMRKIELFMQNLDDEMLIYAIQVASYRLNKREEKRRCIVK